MAESEMEQIHRICTQWLDNADLCELTISPDGHIFMKFIVGGMGELVYWVDIECRGVHVFNLAKDWDDGFNNGIFIGGAQVEKFNDEKAIEQEIYEAGVYIKYQGVWPKQLYKLKLEGGATIQIICTELYVHERREQDQVSR